MFPSGSAIAEVSSERLPQEKETWLANPSYSSPQPAPPVKRRRPTKQPPAPVAVSKELVKPTASTKAGALWYGESPEAYCLDRRPDYSNLSYETAYSSSVANYKRKLPISGLDREQSVLLNDGRSGKSSRSKQGQLRRYYEARVVDASDVMVLSRTSSELGDVLPLAGDSQQATAVGLSERKQLDYNKRLSAQPHDVALWLEFIAAQDSLLQWEGLKDRALQERKLAIFERALEANPKDTELLLGYMKLVAGLWEPKTVVKKWRDVVFVHPNSPAIWLAYINYSRTSFVGFSVEHVCSLYCKAIAMLSAVSEGLIKSHKPLPQDQLWTLLIFSEYCCFLRDAGFTEKAVGCYQALLWLNLSSLSVDQLEEAWGSDSPRPGEAGWGSSSQPQPSSPEESEPELDPGLTERQAWCELESIRCSQHLLPWRLREEPIDPERIVSFSDVKPSLFRIREPQLLQQLVLRCLNFLGALTPVLLTPPGYSSQLLVSPVQLNSGLVKVFGCLLGDDLSIGPPLFTTRARASSLQELVEQLDDQPSPLPCPLIPLLCSQCLEKLSHSSQTSLAIVWITHTLRHSALDSRAAQKLVKTLLKKEQHRNNLELWRACVLVDHLTGNDCVNMLESLLSRSLGSSLVVTLVEAVLGLTPSLVESPALSRPHSSALNALLCLSEGRYNSQAIVTLARVERATFDTSTLDGALCKVYYDLLTENISQANRTIDYLSTQCQFEKELRLKQVRLLLWSPLAPPRELRSALDSALALLPGNIWLLANKRAFPELLACSSQHLQTAIAQLSKAVRYGTGVGLCRKAVASLLQEPSPLSLWLALLVQELAEPALTEDLFYRVASLCPGAKVLYDVACSLLPDGKLERTLELYEEKGIRLHTPLEEVQLLLAT